MNRNENLYALIKYIPDEIDAIIIQDQANRKYLTGFLSTAGTLFITRDAAYFLVDGRYFDAGRQMIKNCTVVLEQDLDAQLRQLITRHGVRTIALEFSKIPLARALHFQKSLAPAEVVFDATAEEVLKKCRQIKTPCEIEAICAAQNIAVSAFEHMLHFARPGVSELELAIELGTFAARHGCQRRVFSMIFTSGKKTALPHGAPPDRVLEFGDIVMVDMSCMVDGFFSDMTRTFCIGKADKEKKNIYNIVYKAQNKAIQKIGPGVVCSDINEISHRIIDEAGYGEYYPHALGHGIGAETHEYPRFSEDCDTLLQPGHVLSVEPGIYLPNKFGIRIEDLIIVTQDGYERISNAPSELIVVG